MESGVKFNGRKTKPGGEKDRLIDILCGHKCVDFSRPLCHELFSQFWTAVFLKLGALSLSQQVVCLGKHGYCSL